MMVLPFPTDLHEFVVWLGSAAAAGVIVAVLFERWPFFLALSSRVKSLVVLAVCVLLPFFSNGLQYVLAIAPPDIVAQVEQVLTLALAGLAVWAVSQYAHGADPEKLSNHLKDWAPPKEVAYDSFQGVDYRPLYGLETDGADDATGDNDAEPTS